MREEGDGKGREGGLLFQRIESVTDDSVNGRMSLTLPLSFFIFKGPLRIYDKI